jgi:hypothetical protein
MKDPNGQAIPGTVLESINPTDGLETRKMPYLKHRCMGFAAVNTLRDIYDGCLRLNNGYASGVNPQDSLKTGIAV